MTGLRPDPPPDPPPAPPDVGAHAVAAVETAFRDELRTWAAALEGPAARVLSRVSTPNWALEWGLSGWIADAYGLNGSQARELLVSDLFLLTAARTLDDLADEESTGSTADAVVLATSLHHLALRRYARLIPPARLATFWDLCDRFTAEWMLATLPPDERPAPDEQPAPNGTDLAGEAHRGSFLGIACTAGCLLAGRPDILDPLLAALRELLIGVVLLDDVFDWPADLPARRRNAFVRFCAAAGEDPVTDRAVVLRAVHLGHVLPRYFAVARQHVSVAADGATLAGCAGLVRYCRWYAAELDGCSAWLQQKARLDLARAFAPGADGQSPVKGHFRSRTTPGGGEQAVGLRLDRG